MAGLILFNSWWCMLIRWDFRCFSYPLMVSDQPLEVLQPSAWRGWWAGDVRESPWPHDFRNTQTVPDNWSRSRLVLLPYYDPGISRIIVRLLWDTSCARTKKGYGRNFSVRRKGLLQQNLPLGLEPKDPAKNRSYYIITWKAWPRVFLCKGLWCCVEYVWLVFTFKPTGGSSIALACFETT